MLPALTATRLGRRTGAEVSTGSAGTNGFLFCDLRGYAAVVDARGDHAAAGRAAGVAVAPDGSVRVTVSALGGP